MLFLGGSQPQVPQEHEEVGVEILVSTGTGGDLVAFSGWWTHCGSVLSKEVFSCKRKTVSPKCPQDKLDV